MLTRDQFTRVYRLFRERGLRASRAFAATRFLSRNLRVLQREHGMGSELIDWVARSARAWTDYDCVRFS